jgi:ABC-type glycerol-3-phosphate transport system substrate-binding protein
VKILRRADRALRGTCLLNCSPSTPAYIAAGADIESKSVQTKMPGRVRDVYETLLGLSPGALVVTGPGSIPFRRGEALFFVCSPHALDWDVLPADMRIAFRPLPVMKRSRQRFMPVVLAVSAASAHPQAAERLVRFLAGETSQRLLAKHRAAFPAHAAVRASLTDDEFPGSAALQNAIEAGKPMGRDARYLIEYLVTVFMPISRRILNRERSVDDGLAELASLTDLYHRGEVGWRAD